MKIAMNSLLYNRRYKCFQKAIELNQVCQPVFKEVKGDAERGFSESECVINGSINLHAQEHFYMETQSCVVIPKDGDEYEIIPSTQGPSWIQVNFFC